METHIVEPRATTVKKNGRRGSAPSAIDELTLASMLSSRVCHDVISPINALTTTVEFLDGASEPEMRDQALQTIGEGAHRARAKLEYFRAAFGLSGSMDEYLELDALKKLVGDFFAGGKFVEDWVAFDAALERPLGRILLNQIFIVAEAMPRGGRMQVAVLDRGALNMIVMAAGPRVIFNARSEALLTLGTLPDGQSLEAKEAPLLLLHRLTKAAGGRLEHEAHADQFVLSYTH